jgi:hypothetical protein
MRPKGSRNTLVKIDYDVIGRLAGISGGTAKAYAQRGEYDSRDLSSLLSWVNSRRQRQGEPLIGMPADNASEAEAHFDEGDSEAVTSTPAPVQAGLLIYDPMTGDYRLNDT